MVVKVSIGVILGKFMNVRQSLLKISAISLVLLSNTSVFGMYKYSTGKQLSLTAKQLVIDNCSIVDNNQELLKSAFNDDAVTSGSIIPIELFIGIGACSSDDTKYALKQTCTYLSKAISSQDINFVSHPLFTTSSRMLNKMALMHSWNNNTAMVNIVRKHLPDDEFVIYSYNECGAYGTGMKGFDKKFAIELPGQCNKKYNTNMALLFPIFPITMDMKLEIDLAMYCAIACDDNEAIKNLAPKINIIYQKVNISGARFIYNDLMIKLITRKNKEAFEFMLKNDPYVAKERYTPNVHRLGPDDDKLLDAINYSRYISPEDKQEYGNLCRQYGEKTEAEANNCIIS